MFVKKFWENRLVEHPGRRKLTDVETGKKSVVDVERDEGDEYKAGDPFSAASMNDLENRISDKSVLTEFLDDGSIKETYEDGNVKLTEFLSDGNIKETITLSDGTVYQIKLTDFLGNGSINETIYGGESDIAMLLNGGRINKEIKDCPV